MPKQNKKVVEFDNTKNTTPVVEVEAEEVTNTTENTNTETNTNTSNTGSKEIVDLEWEEIKNIFSAREQLVKMEDHLGSLFIQFEKSRHEISSRINYIESMIYKMADDLKTHKNIDESLTYELKLPSNPEEKGYFLLRERN